MAIYYNTYPTYGLNKYRSFLAPPICNCGCGSPMYIKMDDEDEVQKFCCDILDNHECFDSAMFAVFHDGRYMAIWKYYDEESDSPMFLKAVDNHSHMFAEIDGEFKFCCYNLIVEDRPGEWMIR